MPRGTFWALKNSQECPRSSAVADVFTPDVESMFLTEMLKRLLQHNRHEAANLKCSSNVRSSARSGLHMLKLSSSGCDPKRSFVPTASCRYQNHKSWFPRSSVALPMMRSGHYRNQI